MSRPSAPRAAVLLPLLLLLGACDDVDTTIAVWSPTGAAGGGPLEDPPQGSGAAPGAAFPDALYLEAESGSLSGPLQVAFTERASGGAYITAVEGSATPDAPGAGRAEYHFSTSAGEFVLWARLQAPDALQNRFWLRVDEGEWFVWRLTTGDAWHWDDVHEDAQYGEPLTFTWGAGAHRLEVASAVVGAKLDRFYLSARGDVPPGNTTPCSPPHSIEREGECIRSCGSYGNVSCAPSDCAEREQLPMYDCAVCCRMD